MSFGIQIFEEYGPKVNGRGTTMEVTNINFKNHWDYQTPYYFQYASVGRPDKHSLTQTYNKYLFFRISGDLPDLKDMKLILTTETDEADTPTPSCSAIKLYGGLTNNYEYNINQLDGTLTYIPDTQTYFPSWGVGAPSSATFRDPHITAGTKTLFSNYLKLQMLVIGDEDWTNVGNTPQYKLRFEINSFRS
jgi:hypothetical protein